MIDLQQTVAGLVLDHSECAAIFQKHKIDFCCRGNMSIQSASEQAGVDAQALAKELTTAIQERRGESDSDPRAWSTPHLLEHIVSTHHAYLRKSLPFIEALAAKVGRVHGDHNPKLRELDKTVKALIAALMPHLQSEEETLFPLLRDGTRTPAVTSALDGMMEEHLVVGDLLKNVREFSEDFTLPSWACNSYRTLFSELQQLEGDILRHVHLENHVLLPRFSAEKRALS